MSASPILFLFAAAAYCVMRGVHDLIEKRYRWGLAGLAAAVLLLMAPFPSTQISSSVPEVPAR